MTKKIKKKKKTDRTLVLKIELGVIIVATIIAVTVAWYIREDRANVNNADIAISSSVYIRVALVDGGVDVLELQEGDAFIRINMPEFFDTEADKLAPGVYGHMDLYITAMSPLTKKCRLTLDFLPEYIDSLTEEEQTEIYNLLKGHIQFFVTRKAKEGGEKGYNYLTPINEDNPLMVDLVFEDEIKTTIYWVWFYEYSDIPDEGLIYEPDNYFDMDKYLPENEADYDLSDKVYFYDYGDTKIGLGAKKIAFRINVDTLNLDGE